MSKRDLTNEKKIKIITETCEKTNSQLRITKRYLTRRRRILDHLIL